MADDEIDLKSMNAAELLIFKRGREQGRADVHDGQELIAKNMMEPMPDPYSQPIDTFRLPKVTAVGDQTPDAIRFGGGYDSRPGNSATVGLEQAPMSAVDVAYELGEKALAAQSNDLEELEDVLGVLIGRLRPVGAPTDENDGPSIGGGEPTVSAQSLIEDRFFVLASGINSRSARIRQSNMLIRRMLEGLRI